MGEPLTVSPVLRATLTVILACWVVGLVLVALG